jgi:predicted small lipoprotein YifL
MRQLTVLLLVLPLAACGGGSGPEGPPPGSVGEQEMQEAMPETKLFDEDDSSDEP